jgi:uncharacterized cysteine cluster protein YcgN (CxxCxxCC family)
MSRHHRPRPPRAAPIDRTGLRPRFWERHALTALTGPEWEALCDGCGKCCLNKLEDEDTREVALTRVACRLLDDDTCACAHYADRHRFVPDCVTLTPENIHANAYWMPRTCAYRLLAEGRPLPDWHPLITGDPESTHRAGISLRGRTVSEFDVPEEEWEDYIVEDET